MSSLQQQVLSLRKSGKSYGEIQSALGKRIAKSTLSYWCRDISLSTMALNRIEKRIMLGGERGRALAHATNRLRRQRHTKTLQEHNAHLIHHTENDIDVVKAILIVLYIAEGAKHRKSSVMFGNADPRVITFFLRLFRMVYKPDPHKFRCTVQCRADQNTRKLERFWARITGIPISQFYKARIDARTIGKVSKKSGYHGVCRIEYFSAGVYHDLIVAGDVILGTI